MSREKQIEEMVKILIDYKNKNHIMASTAILADYAEELYNAGHRKQSEVVREFAEEVKLEFYREFDEIIPSIMADKIDDLVKKYTEDEK